MTVYLCGGINGLSDSDAKDWRDSATEILVSSGMQVLNPMRRDYRGKENKYIAQIVHNDEMDIINSDVILVNASRPSWGTAMEIKYAYGLTANEERDRRKIVAFGAGDNPSPWLSYHCVLYPNLESACRAIIDYHKIKKGNSL